MTRVLVVGRGAPERGGIPTFLAQLEAGVGEHQITLLNLGRELQREGGRFTFTNLARTAADARAVWRHAQRADVTHLHSSLSATSTVVRAGVLGVAARLRGNRVIVHAHGGKLLDWLTPARRPLLRAALRPAARVVAVSERLAVALRSVAHPGRVVVVRNGVEADLFHPSSEEGGSPPGVLFVGGLSRRKGVLDLLEASRQAHEAGAPHRLLLVGGTPDEGADDLDSIRSAAALAGATLTGPLARSELPDVYRSCEVFCLPSWWEASPLSVLEAMASGLSVVATAVGDIPEMLDHGRSGRLVQPRDVAGLTAAIMELLQDASERERLALSARRRVEEAWSVEATRRALDELYDELGANR